MVRDILYRLPIQSCLFCPWQSKRIFLFKKERRLNTRLRMKFRMAESEKRKIHDFPLNLIKIMLYQVRCLLISFSFKITKNARFEIKDMRLNFIRRTKRTLLKKKEKNTKKKKKKN